MKILAHVITLLQSTWVCRWCGGRSHGLTEICRQCGREDLEQGQ